MAQILNVLGWIGTALVFGSLVIRFSKPEWDQYAIHAAWPGLACVILYTLGQSRDIVTFFKRRQARYGALMSVGVLNVLAILVAVSYLAARENKRWDLSANRVLSLPDQ